MQVCYIGINVPWWFAAPINPSSSTLGICSCSRSGTKIYSASLPTVQPAWLSCLGAQAWDNGVHSLYHHSTSGLDL